MSYLMGQVGGAQGLMDPHRYDNVQGPLLANQDGSPVEKQSGPNPFDGMPKFDTSKMRF